MSEELQKGKRKLGMINMSSILIVIVFSCMGTDVKSYQMVHFKCVQFIICQLYLNKEIYLYLLFFTFNIYIFYIYLYVYLYLIYLYMEM